MDKVMKCWICDSVYTAYAFFVGDQSVCPQCRGKAKENDRNDAKKEREKIFAIIDKTYY